MKKYAVIWKIGLSAYRRRDPMDVAMNRVAQEFWRRDNIVMLFVCIDEMVIRASWDSRRLLIAYWMHYLEASSPAELRLEVDYRQKNLMYLKKFLESDLCFGSAKLCPKLLPDRKRNAARRPLNIEHIQFIPSANTVYFSKYYCVLL
jgi:hypothetical protein